LDQLFNNVPVIKWIFHSLDFLIIFVTLAGYQNGITGFGIFQGVGDCSPAVYFYIYILQR
jgi:hypothetical protein